MLKKGNVVVDVSVNGNAYGFTICTKQTLVKSWRELIWDRVRTKFVLVDTTLRLEDRLADIAFGSVSASLYCTYTVQVTAILGDMGDFFAN